MSLGLKGVLAGGVTQVFKELNAGDGLTDAATYRSTGVEVYNTTTGDSTNASDTAAIDVLLTSAKENQTDNPTTHPEAKVATFDRRGFPFAAKGTDTITLSNGELWEVVSILSDPSSSFYRLEVRRP